MNGWKNLLTGVAKAVVSGLSSPRQSNSDRKRAPHGSAQGGTSSRSASRKAGSGKPAAPRPAPRPSGSKPTGGKPAGNKHASGKPSMQAAGGYPGDFTGSVRSSTPRARRRPGPGRDRLDLGPLRGGLLPGQGPTGAPRRQGRALAARHHAHEQGPLPRRRRRGPLGAPSGWTSGPAPGTRRAVRARSGSTASSGSTPPRSAARERSWAASSSTRS